MYLYRFVFIGHAIKYKHCISFMSWMYIYMYMGLHKGFAFCLVDDVFGSCLCLFHIFLQQKDHWSWEHHCSSHFPYESCPCFLWPLSQIYTGQLSSIAKEERGGEKEKGERGSFCPAKKKLLDVSLHIKLCQSSLCIKLDRVGVH